MDVPAGVTQEEGNSGFSIHLLSAVLALIFLARRIQPFLSLVDREVEFCVLTIYSFSTRWVFLFSFFSFSMRKIPFAGIELTSQRVRGYMVHLSYQGDRLDVLKLTQCVYVCVCFLPIHSGHQVRWTYQPGSHRISHPPSICGACLNFSREKDSAIPFPRRL